MFDVAHFIDQSQNDLNVKVIDDAEYQNNLKVNLFDV